MKDLPLRLLRLVLLGVVSFSLLGLLGSSSCYYRVDDDDDFCDDDDFDDDDIADDDDESCGDDDDHFSATSGTYRDSYRLELFEASPAPSADEHPVARLESVQGISIFALFGPGAYEGGDFRALSDRILQVNDDLLGLPASAGRRRFSGVSFGEDSIVVGYVQEVSDGERWRAVPGTRTLFVYDHLGALRSIVNETVLAP